MSPGEGARDMLATFWRLYQEEHPSHQVFALAAEGKVALNATVPLLLHGDGGRTVKKQPLEVGLLVAVLGLDTDQACMTCKCEDPCIYIGDCKSHPGAQRLNNNNNNSYLHHFLLFAFNSKGFKRTPGLHLAMLEVISRDLAEVCEKGVNFGGQLFHFAVIGTRGDAEFHAKAGIFSRSYRNVGHKNLIMCCHLCSGGGAGYPFEDFDPSAAWRSTFCLAPPWNGVPPYHALAFDCNGWRSGKAALFFRGDPFHIFRHGVARNFIGSAIVQLCMDGHFDSPGDSVDIVKRLARAWSCFELFLSARGGTVGGVRSFTRDKLHLADSRSFPWLACKGSDTIPLLEFVQFYATLKGETLLAAGAAAGLATQGIHRHGIWVPATCAKNLHKHVQDFLYAYARLAQRALNQQRTLFAMVPKIHALDHWRYDLQRGSQRRFCVNPALWDCSASEDFIGQVSRQSRRSSSRSLIENTLLAYKVRACLTIRLFKKKRGL